MSGIKKAIKQIVARMGYILMRRDALHYGVDPWLDIGRLDRAWSRATDVIFDVGANVGLTTRRALKEFPDATVFAFEPHPVTFANLRNNLASLPKVSAHNLAFGDAPGEAVLFDYGSEDAEGKINSLTRNSPYAAHNHYTAKEIPIQVTTLDQFCTQNQVETIDVLKIDVEGLELSVLKGGEAMIAAGRIRHIYLEFNDLQPTPGATGGALIPISDYLALFGMRFIATYTDFVLTEGDLFVSANALFSRPPGRVGIDPPRAGATCDGGGT